MTFVVLHAAALAAYLAASVLYGANLALREPRHVGLARISLIAGVALHTLGIGALCHYTHGGPFVSGFGALSVAAWLVALCYVPVDLVRRVPALGALVAPVCCLLLFLAFLPSRSAALATAPELQKWVIIVHVLLAVLSFALFALAACCAAFYLWQYALLKHPSRRAMFRRLPPLETVDRLAFRLVAFALPLLTLGLVLGIARAAAGDLSRAWPTDPHVIISLVAWLVYGTYVVGRTVAGWRGTRPNYILLAGLVVFLAVFLIPGTAHRFT